MTTAIQSAPPAAMDSFAALFEESLSRQEMRAGEVITAEVVRVDANHVVVNAGLKSESFIDIDEFRNDGGAVEVKPGDFFYVPAGTVHAIGAGLSLLEIQQNIDLTYRLFDYGRPRELQLAEGIAASVAQPYVHRPIARIGASREVLVAGPKFVVERLSGSTQHDLPASPAAPVWLMPISAGCTVDDLGIAPGMVWLADGPAQVRLGADDCLLIAYAGEKAY